MKGLARMRRYIGLAFMVLCAGHAAAEEGQWRTHFSYNSVQQIAVTPTEVYALANGAVFSVNKQSEQLTTYTNQSGLHGTELACMAYDSERGQLLLLFADGKLDIMRGGAIRYVSDLYQKRMTASKYCNNVSIYGNKAYLSMEFGVLLFDLDKYEFKDTYYIGEKASEVRVTDVLLHGDSIYAQTEEGVYRACLNDKLVDYRYWTVGTTSPVAFDVQKGKIVADNQGNIWKADGRNGLHRRMPTGEEVYYLPEGPEVNMPYRMTVSNGRLYVVPGGRWAVQNSTPGHVMMLENGHWQNITCETIQAATGKPALDFMNVGVNPKDKDHFFVTSYGTGVYEFENGTLKHHYHPDNSILQSAVADVPERYTRTDGAVFDAAGRVWVENVSDVDNNLVVFMPDGSQKGVNLYTEQGRYIYYTPGEICIDNHDARCKWFLSCRSETAVLRLDDSGTPFDTDDDVLTVRSVFVDQNDQSVAPEFFYTMAQAPNGDIWVGSSAGPIVLEHSVDFRLSNRCKRLTIKMEDGTNLLETERVNAFAFDEEERIWIGTQTAGVYVLDADARQILAHYTSDNTPMPSNVVLSMAFDATGGIMYVGTGGGLVSYRLRGTDSRLPIDTSEDNRTYGSMRQWRAHFAYSSIDEIVALGDKVYATSTGSLFSVDKVSEELEYYSRLTGLNGSVIDHIGYNQDVNNMLITYQDGQLDLVNSCGEIMNIADLYLKQTSIDKQVNDILMYRDRAYLAMDFGIVVLNLKKKEVEDTYYIGENASEVAIKQIAMLGDSIYAASDKQVYVADIHDNLIDYAYWHAMPLPNGKVLQGLEVSHGTLCAVMDGVLCSWQDGQWQQHPSEYTLRGLRQTGNATYALLAGSDGIGRIEDNFEVTMHILYGSVNDILAEGGAWWIATAANGVVRIDGGSVQEFHPSGPVSNNPYRMRFYGDKLYVVPGGRWADKLHREAAVMCYENNVWSNMTYNQMLAATGRDLRDFMNVAQDPQDDTHYFVTSYGTGLIEVRGQQVVKVYTPDNSPLEAVVPADPAYYTRTDGAMYDDQGNLWLLNAGSVTNVRVVQPDGKWTSFNINADGTRIVLNTPGEIMVDRRNPQWKWIPECRSNTGLILLQDNGTPANPNDDKVTFRREWFDQNGNQIVPEFIYSLAQDRDNTIWVGTSTGIFSIPASVDFATSNRCERVIISRNDGTNLGDYMLGSEQINCIVIDGANRKWIGTASSGVFLLDIQRSIENTGWDVETVAHFTTANSLLPSDNILSIAIQETTGEVFIGTSAGLVSYMSDAVEPADSFDELYAYPNPVRPNYYGYITIKGLMEDSEVRITDASGNLVKLIQGNGGEAVWDGTNTAGKRVASGVYTAVCNTTDGKGHGTAKILIMN